MSINGGRVCPFRSPSTPVVFGILRASSDSLFADTYARETYAHATSGIRHGPRGFFRACALRVGRLRSGHGQRLASGNRERDVHSSGADHAPWDSRSPSRFGTQTAPGLKKSSGAIPETRSRFPIGTPARSRFGQRAPYPALPHAASVDTVLTSNPAPRTLEL